MTNAEQEQLIVEMTEALQEAIDVQEKYSEKLDELAEENSFLSETILQNKLGRITLERKALIEKMEYAETNSKERLREAKEIQQEYNEKLKEVIKLNKELKNKVNHIDDYIKHNVDAKIREIEYSMYEDLNNKEAQTKEKQAKEKNKFTHKLIFYRIAIGVSITIATIMFILVLVNHWSAISHLYPLSREIPIYSPPSKTRLETI